MKMYTSTIRTIKQYLALADDQGAINAYKAAMRAAASKRAEDYLRTTTQQLLTEYYNAPSVEAFNAKMRGAAA